MVGDIELRGRLNASTRFAVGLPSSVGTKLKSVSSLLRRKPLFVMRRAPKPSSIVVVKATALPRASITEIWLVPCSIPSGGRGRSVFWNGGSPACRSEEHTSELQSRQY